MADDPLQAEMALTWKAVEELAETVGLLGVALNLRARSPDVIDELARLTGTAPDKLTLANLAEDVMPGFRETLDDLTQGIRDTLDDLTQFDIRFKNLGQDIDRFAEDIDRFAEKLGEPKPRAAVERTAKNLERAGISGLTPKDLVLLSLVALLLLHGSDAHPTVLGEAIEGNQLQIAAIFIALAAYLKKSE
jgi:hypothetical protein